MPKILIVDDDPHQLEAFVNRLKIASGRYKIDTAKSADDAIRRLKRETYNVVVTDLRMPSDNYEGFQVIKHIKKNDPEFINTKVIVLTVVGSEEPEEGIRALRLAIQHGVSDYIIKKGPDVAELLDLTIQKVMMNKTEISPVKIGQVFIACPYDDHHNDIYKELCSKASSSSFTFIRADDSFHGEYLKEEIYKEIAESEYVITFVSGLNANVMYELGLAHGMGKKVIIIKDESTTPASDLKGIQYICYQRDAFLSIFSKIFSALEDFSPELD